MFLSVLYVAKECGICTVHAFFMSHDVIVLNLLQHRWMQKSHILYLNANMNLIQIFYKSLQQFCQGKKM